MAYDTSALFLNLIGNLFCFSPFAILLQLSFEKMKDPKKLLITTFFICLGAELLQCLSMNGSFDIDDIILNYSGILIIYFIIRKDIINFVESFLLNKKVDVNYRKLVIIACISLVLSAILLFSYFYRIKKERDYIRYISDFEIEYHYTDSASSDYREKIYEDEYVIFLFKRTPRRFCNYKNL